MGKSFSYVQFELFDNGDNGPTLKGGWGTRPCGRKGGDGRTIAAPVSCRRLRGNDGGTPPPPPPEDLPLSCPCPHPPTLALTLRLACLLTSVVVLATAPLVLPMPSRSFLAIAVIVVGINLKGTNTMAEKRAEMPRWRLPPPPSSLPPKWWVRHPRRLHGRSTTATDCRPCASPSPAPAPPPQKHVDCHFSL